MISKASYNGNGSLIGIEKRKEQSWKKACKALAENRALIEAILTNEVAVSKANHAQKWKVKPPKTLDEQISFRSNVLTVMRKDELKIFRERMNLIEKEEFFLEGEVTRYEWEYILGRVVEPNYDVEARKVEKRALRGTKFSDLPDTRSAMDILS